MQLCLFVNRFKSSSSRSREKEKERERQRENAKLPCTYTSSICIACLLLQILTKLLFKINIKMKSYWKYLCFHYIVSVFFASKTFSLALHVYNTCQRCWLWLPQQQQQNNKYLHFKSFSIQTIRSPFYVWSLQFWA